MPHRLKRPRQLTALIALVFWGLGFLVSRAAEEPGESSTLLIPGSIGVIVLVAINAILSIRVRHRGAALNAGFAAGLAGVAIVAAMYPRIDYAGVPYLLCAAPIVAMIVLAVRNPADSPPRADGAGGEAVGADGAGGEADEAHDNTLSLLGWVALIVGVVAFVSSFLPMPFLGLVIIAFYGGMLVVFLVPAIYLSVALATARYRYAAVAAVAVALVLAWPLAVRNLPGVTLTLYLVAIGALLLAMALLPNRSEPTQSWEMTERPAVTGRGGSGDGR